MKNKTRRDFLKVIGVGASAINFPFSLSFCGKKSPRPNIIFIMSDDHAEQAISCYGSQLIQTPNIDRIASEGVRFQNSFVTNSICAPSRAVLLTGKYSHINGLCDNRDEFNGSQLTFPKLLQQTGYQTAMIGKWHLKSDPTGFDYWKILKGQGQYYNPVFNENGLEKEYTGYTTDLITDFAIESLDSRDNTKPFCFFVHHKAPHRNWMPHTKYLDKFEDNDIPLPENFFDSYEGRRAAEEADMHIADMYLSFDMKLKKDSYQKETGSGGNKNYAENVENTWINTYERLTNDQKKAWDEYYDKINEQFKNSDFSEKELLNWKYQRYIKDYLRCILSVDESVGRILDYLDNNDLSQNTLVVYTSDQGFYLGEHGWYDKRFMYEESLSMPLLMRYPQAINPGTVNENIVMNLDFAPTFLDFAGVKCPDEVQGESLRYIASERYNEQWRKSMYYHYYEFPHGWHNVRKHYGVRTERYKLIHFYGDEDFWELYDLKTDPNEMNNIYNFPEYEALIKNLKEELIRLQKKYKDTEFLN